MNTVMIKSGVYYETPATYVALALSAINKNNISHFLKADNSFIGHLVGKEFRIYQHYENPMSSAKYRTLDFQLITSLIEKYGRVYFGVALNDTEAVSFDDYLKRLSYYSENKDGMLIDLVTEEIKEDRTMFALGYGFKMGSEDLYAFYLTGFCRTANNLTNDDDPAIKISDDLQIVCVNDGSAIRDQFIDVQFEGVRRHFKNSDLVVGHSVFAEKDKNVVVSLFGNRKGLNTEEFQKNFKVEVESSFDILENEDGLIEFRTGSETKVGYLSIKVVGSELYNDVVSAEIKETLQFDFTVSVY